MSVVNLIPYEYNVAKFDVNNKPMYGIAVVSFKFESASTDLDVFRTWLNKALCEYNSTGARIIGYTVNENIVRFTFENGTPMSNFEALYSILEVCEYLSEQCGVRTCMKVSFKDARTRIPKGYDKNLLLRTWYRVLTTKCLCEYRNNGNTIRYELFKYFKCRADLECSDFYNSWYSPTADIIYVYK